MDKANFNREINPATLKDVFKRMGPLIKPYWFRAILGVLITAPVGALDGAVALFLKYYVDNVVVAKDAAWAVYIPALIIAFAVLQGVLNYTSTYLNSWVGMKITTDLKKKLYHKLLTFDPAFFDMHNSGDIVYRFYADADTASNSLINNAKMFLTRTFSSIGLVCVLFYNSWQLTLIAIVVLGGAVLPMQNVRRRIKKITPKIVTSGSDVITSYNETCGGYKTITSYNIQGYQYKKQNSILDELFSLSMKMVKHTNWLSPLMHVIVAVGVAGVIWYGNSLIIKGTITSGNFASFIAALLMLYTPLKFIGNSFIDLQKAFLAIERVFEMLEVKPQIKSAKGAIKIDDVKKDIVFDNVSFEYKKDTPVLKNINIKIPLGTTTALVGNSGGGKTTFVNLIPRFYDATKGAVKVDGIDVKEIDLVSLRSQIAVVFQDNFLFSGTIKENILIGRPDATDEEVQAAVEGAHLSDFIGGLKNKLDTDVGERGVMLSGGQKQRIAIARALLKQAPVVILDEATSALDNKSEAIVQKAIDNLMKDRTVFVIAHRLTTVQNADNIVVINEGEIVESGTHETLLKSPIGAYKTLYEAQFKHKAKAKADAADDLEKEVKKDEEPA
ncbi:MAG: ATP-binding cassette domain-containing protein [Elusimicrobiota bacterium]|jgi:subfamily B ATP-binding cassette protein MsbA|nr:ATP-binding cassette domain-containing protein [Elusimicrobiota bacterium]